MISYIIERVCPLTFMIADIVALNLQFINCSRPGLALDSLSHCCSDAGIRMGTYVTIVASYIIFYIIISY